MRLKGSPQRLSSKALPKALLKGPTQMLSTEKAARPLETARCVA
jgi:hypothetical protein